jgi:CheY-like chemotaxis protein
MAGSELDGRSILVADDEDVFLRSVVEGLAAELPGVTLHTACDGVAALAEIERHAVDLVVTDVNMPRMDGMSLIAELVSRGIRAPVVLVTAFGTRSIELEARRHGVVSVIDKPIDFPFLVEICRNTLRSLERGALGGVTLAGLLQLLELERRSCTVRVLARGASGRVFLDRGQVVGSTHDGLQGMEALCHVLSWPDPRIELGPPQSVAHGEPMSLQEALLEAARRSDEHARDEQAVAPDPLSLSFDPEPIAIAITPPQPTTTPTARETAREEMDMAGITESINAAMSIQGAIAAALVDYESGMCLGSRANGFPIEVAAAGNTDVVRAKLRVMKDLGITGRISDILITLDAQFHLLVPLRQGNLFLYMAIDRATGNLALARLKLTEIEKNLAV